MVVVGQTLPNYDINKYKVLFDDSVSACMAPSRLFLVFIILLQLSHFLDPHKKMEEF